MNRILTFLAILLVTSGFSVNSRPSGIICQYSYYYKAAGAVLKVTDVIAVWLPCHALMLNKGHKGFTFTLRSAASMHRHQFKDDMKMKGYVADDVYVDTSNLSYTDETGTRLSCGCD